MNKSGQQPDEGTSTLIQGWQRLFDASDESGPEGAPDVADLGNGISANADALCGVAGFVRRMDESIRRSAALAQAAAESARAAVELVGELAERARIDMERARSAADEARHSAEAARTTSAELEWLLDEIRRTESRLRCGRCADHTGGKPIW
jgi:hypothetical protein